MRNHDRLIGEIEDVDVNMPIVLMFVQCPIFIEMIDVLQMLFYTECSPDSRWSFSRTFGGGGTVQGLVFHCISLRLDDGFYDAPSLERLPNVHITN